MLHELTDASRNYSFAASHEPALTIAPGDAVRFHTRDCFDGQVPMEQMCIRDRAPSCSNIRADMPKPFVSSRA